jgi:hypothetical protein
MKKESKEELDNILLHCDRDNLTFKLRSLGVCERFYEGMISDYWKARIHELIELCFLQEELLEQYRINTIQDNELINQFRNNEIAYEEVIEILKRTLSLSDEAFSKQEHLAEVYYNLYQMELLKNEQLRQKEFLKNGIR